MSKAPKPQRAPKPPKAAVTFLPPAFDDGVDPSAYEAALAKMPGVVREELLDGSWDVGQPVDASAPAHRVSVLYTSGTPPVTRARCEHCGDLEFTADQDVAAGFDAVLEKSRGQSARHVVG